MKKDYEGFKMSEEEKKLQEIFDALQDDITELYNDYIGDHPDVDKKLLTQWFKEIVGDF